MQIYLLIGPQLNCNPKKKIETELKIVRMCARVHHFFLPYVLCTTKNHYCLGINRYLQNLVPFSIHIHTSTPCTPFYNMSVIRFVRIGIAVIFCAHQRLDTETPVVGIWLFAMCYYEHLDEEEEEEEYIRRRYVAKSLCVVYRFP